MLPKLLNIIGIILMAAVILITLPVTIPKVFGYQIYGVLTDSMRPMYRPGDVVYVKPVSPGGIQTGDVISYRMGTDTDLVTSHRVVEIDHEKQEFRTKGDANKAEDAYPVSFSRMIGRVAFRIPFLGYIVGALKGMTGIIIAVLVFLTAFFCWTASAALKKKEGKQ